MKTKRFHIHLFAALLLALGLVPTTGHAAGNCYAIGQQVAAENGGQLASATAANRGGKQVCVVVVLVPGNNGGHPSRKEIVVPLN